MTMSMMALLLAANTGLQLTLAPEKNEVLVGEPLRLAVTWRADRELPIPGAAIAGGWNYDYFQIWVDGPTGRRPFLTNGPPSTAGHGRDAVGGQSLGHQILTSPG